MSDFNITLFEACELLNRSKKSISRYIRRGLLHPERVKSQQGTLEYRFNKADLEAFKENEALKADETGQDGTEQTGQEAGAGVKIPERVIENKRILDETRQDTPDKTGQDGTREIVQENEVITLLKETTGLLRDQLKTKDEQISSLGGKIDQLIERDRETNILLKGLQDKVLMLEGGKPEQTGRDRGDGTGQDEPKRAKAGFWKRLFSKQL